MRIILHRKRCNDGMRSYLRRCDTVSPSDCSTSTNDRHLPASVTASYRPGLFHCYDVADLPRTNNDLEHVFGSPRYHERRATDRKQASPGLVVRGSVRLVATIATQSYHFSGPDLAPRDLVPIRITLRREKRSSHRQNEA